MPHAAVDWLGALLKVGRLEEGSTFTLDGRSFTVRHGIPRSHAVMSAAQAQTGQAFAFKWQQQHSFDSPTSLGRARAWLLERYGNVATAAWLTDYGDQPLLVDAGCGAGMSAIELWGEALPRLRYLGIDVSEAIDVAKQRFAEHGLPGAFVQTDLGDIPLPIASVDLIFAEGVLHHTESTERALKRLAELLAPGGRFLFYVYRRKGPLREFTDDHVRAALQAMPPEEAWEAMKPLTRLGIALGEREVEIEVPEAVELLGIPAGRTTLQRLFYWHVAKAFYHPALTFDEMNHINFDWYAPAHACRQSPEEVRQWCAEAGLTIEREVVEPAGITVVARRRS